MATRRNSVPRRRRPIKPAVSGNRTLRDRLRDFVLSFTPGHFRAYWLSRTGLRRLAQIAGAGFLLLFVVFLYFAKDLPSPGKVNARVSAQTTRFYDRTGQTVLYELHGDQNRTVIDFSQMPDNIKNATVAVEDKNFYHEGAFSFLGFLRAAIVDIIHHGAYQGGSTITQQYVKNALLDPTDHSLGRKFKELILSLEINQFYSKNDILKLYLNEIPYGSQAYGIQAAAKTFFNKDAKDLTLPESSLLAAIPQAPSYYSPYGQNQSALLARQHYVLDQMASQRYISQADADAAKKVDILAEMPKEPQIYGNVIAPYFSKYLEAVLKDKYSEQYIDTGGLRVVTTLDLTKQSQAEAAINNNMAKVRSLGGSNAALVAADPRTGQVLAWVGGRSFSDSQVDVAEAPRQPGSSFKPFVYSTLFSRTDTTYGPGTTLYDVPTDFGGGYKPHNYCLCNYGIISLRQALGNSLNVPSVKVLYMAGVAQSIDTAHKLGITTLNQDPGYYGLSLVLGTGEVKLADMVSGYSGFATGGTHIPQQLVLKITDPKGKVIEDNTKPPTPKRILDQQAVYELNSILSDASARTLTFGANFSPLIIPGKTAAVKTGTTENFRDAWTIGYTQSLVAGVWTGNNDGSYMSGSSGAVAAPIWHDFMVPATKDAPNEPFVRPSGIQSVTLDANTGRLPAPDTKSTRTDIFASWYKPTPATSTKSAVIDTVSGKLATNCTPPLAKKTIYNSEIHAEIPSDDPSYSRWDPPVEALAQKLGYDAGGGTIPTDSDNVHNCGDTKPQVHLAVTGGAGGMYNLGASYTSGTFPANKLDVYFDDQIISTQSPISANPYNFTYVAPSNGNHTFKAIVTDTGLYQAEDDQPTNVTGVGNGAFQGIAPADGSSQSTGLITFSWTADPSASSYDLWIDGSLRQANIPGTSTNQIISTANFTHHWFVKVHNGNDQTATYSFST